MYKEMASRSSRPPSPWTLPNLLSLFRIALCPSLVLLLESAEGQGLWGWSYGKWAAGVVTLAGISDLLDGYLARRWKSESLLGKFLDPLADKLLLLVGLTMLLQLGRVEAWLVIALLSREIFVTALRGVAAAQGLVIAAGSTGKYKLVFQLVGLGCLMWDSTFLGLPTHTIGNAILYAALAISFYSGIQYTRRFLAAMG